MSRTRHSWKRILEVAGTSLIAGLSVWTGLPADTDRAHAIGLIAVAVLGPVLVYLRHGKREPALRPL